MKCNLTYRTVHHIGRLLLAPCTGEALRTGAGKKRDTFFFFCFLSLRNENENLPVFTKTPQNIQRDGKRSHRLAAPVRLQSARTHKFTSVQNTIAHARAKQCSAKRTRKERLCAARSAKHANSERNDNGESRFQVIPTMDDSSYPLRKKKNPFISFFDETQPINGRSIIASSQRQALKYTRCRGGEKKRRLGRQTGPAAIVSK